MKRQPVTTWRGRGCGEAEARVTQLVQVSVDVPTTLIGNQRGADKQQKKAAANAAQARA
jgi:hypothetical protein